MLVITTVIYLLVGWARDVPIDGLIQLDAILDGVSGGASKRGVMLRKYLDIIFSWFNDHMAIGVILSQTISVLATRIAFRKAEVRWSLVELFFAHIYLAVQYYIVAMMCILFFDAELDEFPAWGVMTLIILIYQWLTLAQLYNSSFWKSLFRSIVKGFWQLFISLGLIAFVIMLVMFI